MHLQKLMVWARLLPAWPSAQGEAAEAEV